MKDVIIKKERRPVRFKTTSKAEVERGYFHGFFQTGLHGSSITAVVETLNGEVKQIRSVNIQFVDQEEWHKNILESKICHNYTVEQIFDKEHCNIK